MRLESELQVEVEYFLIELIKRANIFFKRVHNSYMANFPDFLVCYKGIFVGIELKRDENTSARAGQLLCMKDIQESGGVVAIIGSMEQLKNFFKKLDEAIEKQDFTEMRLDLDGLIKTYRNYKG